MARVEKLKATLTSPGIWVKTHAKMHSVIALLVFAVGLCATVYYWNNLRQSVRVDMEIAYKRQSTEIGEAASGRLALYESFLRGSAGLFKIHSGLTQAEWDEYHQPYSIKDKYPDIQGIGVSRYLKKDEVPAYLQRRAAQGDTNFTIRPAGDRDIYVPVTFNAQYTGNNGTSRGFDGYSDPVRRKAMQYAIDTGKPAMSGKVNLVSSTNPNRSAFILYLPVFREGQPTATIEQRRAAISGFSYVAVDFQMLMDIVLASGKGNNIAIQITDSEQSADVGKAYQTDNFNAVSKQDGWLVDDNQLTLYGHKWHIVMAAAPDIISAREQQLPQQALWRGILTCVFFAGLVWYLITDRERKYARQKQEEVQTAKDDLLSLASHQLRTPATVVKQYVGMLLQGYAGQLSQQQMDMLDSAYESNERQLEIINQLLYVARMDAGRIKLKREKTDLAKLMRDVARDQGQTVADRNQQLSFRLPKRPLYAEVDPHFMRMVLENMLSNASKYTPEGGTITLGVRRAPGHIVLRVTDTGVGIDPSLHDSVFEKFTRVENELSTDVNGSGVGL
ncbi:MAG TPA: CHASE domain-containing protein, partial [Candidatus Saccharimonadales bacterium]|nr:CHASE domain-containing protein [Candidatus Saccharimonadales bacterium]